MRAKNQKRNGLREIPDDLWNLIKPILPPDKEPGANGRPRVPNRTVLNGILYVLRTGCQWKMVPRQYSSGSTCHLRFQTWVRMGIFERMWRVCLKHYDDLQGIDWRFQSLDGVIVSAPVKGGIKSEKTLPIEANWVPNAIFSPTRTASRWRLPCREPTPMT